jgi:heavy metal translocating P-type ATPase
VVTVLVIACPHALGLAIPLVAQISTAIGAKNGLLIRSRVALEEARSVQVVLFDKTGTLTRGQQGVTDIVPADGDMDADRLLELAAAVEARAEHPIAQAIVAEARERGLVVPGVSEFQTMAGRGATAVVGTRSVAVASARVATERGLLLGSALVQATRQAAEQGKGVVYVIDDDTVLGMIALADVVRDESAEAVRALKRRGIRVAMLTGDSHEVGHFVAGRLGIEEVFAEILPGQKAEVVLKLQAGGTKVAMVGDGVNDAPALAQADLGIAIGTGTDVAIAASDITLIGGDLRTIVTAIALSRKTVGTIKQGLFWAFGYNIVLIPVAMGLFWPFFGILLNPVLAAAAMAMSSVSVVTNALRLRGFRPAASVQEILHPPLRARIADWGYLAAIAVLALAIGAGALWLSERGGMGVSGGMETTAPIEQHPAGELSRLVESRHAASTAFSWDAG